MVEDYLGDDTHAAAMRLTQEGLEIPQCAVGRMHVGVVGDVVAIVQTRRGIEGEQPERRDAEVLQISDCPIRALFST
jgi:hypothetical protein